MQGLHPNHMHIFRPWRKHVQSFKKIGIKLYECAHKVHVPTVYTLRSKNDQVHKVEKVTKNNLTIISKPHAYPHTMMKTPAKFQKDWYKTVRGVVLKRRPG